MSQDKIEITLAIGRRTLYGTACVLVGALLGATTMTAAFADGDDATQTVLGADLIMPYDGYMMIDSAPLTGSRTIKFELYQAQSGGAAIWTEEQAVQLYNGRFSVGLGTSTSLTSTILDAEKLWLAMTVVDSSSGTRTEIPLSGRQAIEPAPFAAWAGNSADMQVAGSLDVDGTATFQSTATVAGKLTAQGDVEVQGTLDVTGDTVTLSSDTALSVNSSDQLYISPSKAHAGGVYVGNDLYTNYNTRLGNGTADTTTITGPATLENTATIQGAATFEAAATFEGGTTFEANLNTGTNKIKFTDTVGTIHDLTGSDDSYPDEGISLRTRTNPSSGEPIFRVMSSGGSERLRVEHDGETSVTNTFRASGDITAESDLTVTGSATVQTDLTVNGDLNTFPAGSYCIISGDSSGTCPTGFTAGRGRFDTEDNNNNDSFEGTTGGLYDGGSNGRIDLRVCCK